MFSKAYCINFHTNCEINIESIELKAKKPIPKLPDLSREGYHFNGWFKDEGLMEEFNLEKMPKEDINLYAKWLPITLDEFLQDINYFTKSANILKSLQNDYEDVPDFKDTKEKETKPKTKKKTSKKTTKKKTTKAKTKKPAKVKEEEIKEENIGEE
ncbi:MAG: InlB B-repeat-containing protein [Bacilli bacterium]|nr:InlB B-repeat-containing protein [Bacilli bacterium]